MKETRLQEVTRQLEAAQRLRDNAIREASAQGMTRRAVADATGLSPARIQQIVNA